MRDDSNKWDIPQPTNYEYTENGITLASVPLARQTLISGPNILTQTEPPIAAWPDIVTSDCYALPIRRDRVLLVNGPPLSQGWHDETRQAVSDASDAYAVFDINGERSLEVLKRGAELSLNVPSRSVARILFGLGVFLYRYDNESRFRIHVASGQTEALIRSLKVSIR
ncbi:hypothetical protein OO012_00230 [Rhodobacteraceae bacterium KMM 6894]|nr:hypothetical protein [Rhodobacteraceae bacterium KMM 6894]